jgi:RimJ/RimL family protein N-acetyltransferase
MIPRKLTVLDKDFLITHLCALQGEDRRLRFGMVVSDDYIKDYVTNSFDGQSKWFGVFHIDGHIVAACHAAISNGQAELGCSVDQDYRNLKLAQAMFDRAVTWLRTQGVTDVFMHCLTENGAMKHIARKNYMTVVSEGGESDANVQVAPATPFTPMVDAYVDRMAMYDMIFKQNIAVLKRMYT